MRKPRSYAEIYNDKWDTVVNVFHVLRDPVAAQELERVLRLTPFSRTEFRKCGEVNIQTVADPIEKARLTIFRSFAGFGSASINSKYSTGFRANSHRSGTGAAQDWVNYPDNINAFIERLKGVVIENKDYREVIQQHDSLETLVYLDPPYVHDTRNMKRGNAAYEHEMTDEDHTEMAAIVHQVKGMVVISGYDCMLYEDLYKDWFKVHRKALADGAAERVETLWLNKSAAQNVNRKLF